MKVLIWSAFAVVALLWTASIAVFAALVSWAGQALAAGDLSALAKSAAQMPVPEWVALWVDPAWVRATQEFALWALQALDGTLPFAGAAVGWLVPLIWIGWGLVLTLMLVLAAVAHWVVGRPGSGSKLEGGLRTLKRSW